MGGQGKWKAREGRNRDKVNCCGNRSVNYPPLPIPTPSSYPSPYRSYPILSEVGDKTTRHFYAILRSLSSRLRNLEGRIQESLELGPKCHTCQRKHPSQEDSKVDLRIRRSHECREGKCERCRRPLNFISSYSKQQEIKKNHITIGIQTESPYLSRTIDVMQCPYCSS